MDINRSCSSSNDDSQNFDYCRCLSDLNSACASYPPSPAVNVQPRFNPLASLFLHNFVTSDDLEHPYERVLASSVPNLAQAENVEDPTRSRVGNNVRDSSHYSQSCQTKDLIDRVQTTPDNFIGNGEGRAIGKDFGSHESEKDNADTNTELALRHEPSQHDIDQESNAGPGRRPKRIITLEEIEECWEKQMKMEDALRLFKVKRSTFKRRLKALGVKWKQCSRSGNNTNPVSRSSTLRRGLNDLGVQWNDANLAGHDYHPPPPEPSLHSDPGPVRSVLNNSTPPISSESLGKEEPVELATKHLVVKAARGKHKVRFDFSNNGGTPRLLELENLVAANLPLESGKFKVTYQDEDKERITMFNDSHLEYALSLVEKSQSNILRLNVIDI